MNKLSYTFGFLILLGLIACSDKVEAPFQDMSTVAKDKAMELDASTIPQDASEPNDKGPQALDQPEDAQDASTLDATAPKDLASPELDHSVTRDMALSPEARACILAKGTKQTIQGGPGGDLADNPKLEPPQGAYLIERTVFGVGAHLSFETTGTSTVALFFSKGADVLLFQNSDPDGTGGSSTSPQNTVTDPGCSELKQSIVFESVQAGAHLMRIKSASPPVTLVILVM